MSLQSPFVPGQRWISTAEPELGLATVLRVEPRSVQLLFAATATIRQYALASAPLLRAEFKPGDRITGHGGRALRVERVEQSGGLITYHGEGSTFHEGELDDMQAVSKADDRLISGRVDANARFEFRLQTLARRARARSADTFGYSGARVELIEHQLRVAEIAASRNPVRVLLADEVGLGKTIEACLILARLIHTQRIRRVLVLVPEPLVHQWFIELMRRFNLRFSIFDEERCEAIEIGGEGRNPFEDDQLVLSDTAFAVGSAKRREQIAAAGWDMLVVDEAHHLAWSPELVSPEYALVETLAAKTPGLILLTATPEQLGRSGHFARLRLLDPARFHDLETFQAESQRYVDLSPLADRLLVGEALDPTQTSLLEQVFAPDPVPESAEERLDQLVDRHGTGRVMFRHRRAAIGGFPVRSPEFAVIEDGLAEGDSQRLLLEFEADVGIQPPAHEIDYAGDPRIDWLVGLLDSLAPAKVLLICRTQAKVLAIEEALRTRSGVKIARFHEGLGLAQRDRNAAFFADNEGARLLLCSEIGSEGRNFQFAHHLVLWDLPLDPDLLEQRIGRLDRIGQRETIRIHVPMLAGSAQALLARWYDEALDAFRVSPADGRELLRRFGKELIEQAMTAVREGGTGDFPELIARTRAAHAELAGQIHLGRDRLLEIASERAARNLHLRDRLIEEDTDLEFDDYVLGLLEQFNVEQEEIGERTWALDPELATTAELPGLQEGRTSITFDRRTALAREDIPLLRYDHPLVASAMDMMLDSELGNAAFLVDDTLPQRNVLLECVYVLECVADPALHIDRWLPPTPIRVVIDHKRASRPDFVAHAASVARAADRAVDVARYRKFLMSLVPAMGEIALAEADTEAANLRTSALDRAGSEFGAALDRLQALSRVNPGVRAEELSTLESDRDKVLAVLPLARLRLDAMRFICSPDFLSLR